MKLFGGATELLPLVGTEIGTSEWLTVDQAMIDAFAALTGDHQWIHVDVERAKEAMPGGRTIAHGYLVLALVPRMLAYRVSNRSHGLNYGLDRLRFTAPVPSGSRIRMRQRLAACDRVESGYRVTNECVIEIEGQARPGAVFNQIVLYLDE